MSEPVAVRTAELGKRYGATWALRDCTLEIPAGSVTALVGPNGAGKTTLLHLLIGLGKPTAGTVEVLGLSPRRDAYELLPRLGFVAQDHPLYRNLSIAETFKLVRKLNPGWDERQALGRIDHLGLDAARKIGKLSGGQQAQVALTLALAKQPELLVLDEPVASLDPLARREFLNAVLEAVAETQMTVVISSHIVSELERVCDHLITLADSRTQLAGPIADIVASHRLLTGPRSDSASVARVHDVIREGHTERQTTLLVRANGHVYDACWEQHEVDLEEIVLAYLGYKPGISARAAGAREVVRA
jgi:ABC-2 type transport system ATP-binding protein